MLKIIINNTYELEVPNESVKYNMQVNDIADLESRQCNYTDSFSIPKSRENVYIFNQLGFAGDVSNYPYEKITADLLDNGVHIVRNGWLDIRETTNEYKINIREGLIDLFKAIENKTFGDNVDLSEINHNKTLSTVIASFTNENYRYIINDYGGKTHTDNGTKINIDYLVPSVRVKYLWNKIFATFGFNYLGDVFEQTDFEELWLTYPKGANVADVTINYADLKSLFSQSFLPPNNIPLQTYKTWNALNTVTNGSLISNFSYVSVETGSYSIKAKAKGLTRYFVFKGFPSNSDPTEYRLVVKVNGVPVNEFFSNNTQYDFTMDLVSGDVVDYEITDAQSNASLFPGYKILNFFDFLTLEEITLKIEKYNSLISFSDELKNLKITDFLKEILNYFALTIFVDKDNNYVFKTFDERLLASSVDWSEKYKERTSETYTPKSYAQRNYFKQKYNDENSIYNDGFFDISNKNINESKTVTTSIFYSHEKDFASFYINATTNEVVLPTLLWTKEISENSGAQEVKYKALSNRFYLLRTQTITKNSVLRSEKFSIEQAVTSLPMARYFFTSYKDFTAKYYKNIKLLLEDFRMHKIKLALNCIDIHNLDFDKVYYFEQEQNYYLLNKLGYENGKLSNAEFYRVRKTIINLCEVSTLSSIAYNEEVVCNTPAITNFTSIGETNYEFTGTWTSNVWAEYSSDGGTTWVRDSSQHIAGTSTIIIIPLTGVNIKGRLVAVCDETKISNVIEYVYPVFCDNSVLTNITYNP
jgi:hypothetical protein